MAYGFLAAGVGLFVIPHDAGLFRLIEEAGDAAAADHVRALIGLLLVGGGLLAVVAGGAIGVQGRRRA
jgi:hypothetical protein